MAVEAGRRNSGSELEEHQAAAHIRELGPDGDPQDPPNGGEQMLLTEVGRASSDVPPHVPTEVLEEIFLRLGTEDLLLRACRVCKTWLQVPMS